MTCELALSPHLAFRPPPPPPLHDDHAISRIIDALPWVLLQPCENSWRGGRGWCQFIGIFIHMASLNRLVSREGGGRGVGVPTSPFCGLIEYLHCSPIVTDPGVCFSVLTWTCTTDAACIYKLQPAAIFVRVWSDHWKLNASGGWVGGAGLECVCVCVS